MTRNQTEPYMATYLHSRGAKLGLPIAGSFELTARCNFRCPMCYVHLTPAQIDARQGRELTAEQWIRLAQDATDQGMVFALLTGGEPFLRPDFFDIYNAMKAMGLMISINTNGSLLEGDIRKRLLENPPFRVNLSLYGGCSETYRHMCGQDAYEKVIETIRALKSAGIDVRLNLSITPYNIQDLEQMYAVSQETGVHVKGTSYMYSPIRVNGGLYGHGNRMEPEAAAAASVRWDLLRFSPEEFALRAARMQRMEAEATDGGSMASDSGVSCRAGSSSFWVTWDGRMLPCGMMPYPEAFPLESGFRAAWEQIRSRTKEIRMPAACSGCAKRGVCGVCAAMCMAETGAFDQAPAYVCRMADETIRLTNQVSQKTAGRSVHGNVGKEGTIETGNCGRSVFDSHWEDCI